MKDLQKQKKITKKTHCKKSLSKNLLYSLFLVIIIVGVGFLLPSPNNDNNFGEFSWEMLDE